MEYLEPREAVKYEDDHFCECRAVKVYFLIYGRNAWNTTWIQKYSTGCMHSSLSAAKLAAEKKRVQGSVFSIEELPAIQFINPERSIIITEINNPSTLNLYREITEAKDLNLMEIFNRFSPKRLNSVIRLIWHKSKISVVNKKYVTMDNDFDSLEKISGNTAFSKYKSYSHGKAYLLGWNKASNNIIAGSALKIASDYNGMIVDMSEMESL